MSLTQALNSASSGLRLAQAGLSLVAANVANAETPGYVRKTVVQSALGTDAFITGVRVSGVNRELDQYVQRQLRVESAGGAYTDLRAQFHDRLVRLFGEPGSDSALETTFNSFTSALQALQTSPESYSARAGVLSAAQILTQRLNGMSADVQALRAEAESGMADAVTSANEAMRQIASLNQQLAAAPGGDATAAALMDQRDRYIDRLAALMDIRVVDTGHNQLTVFTNSGVQLVGAQAARLDFQAQGAMRAGAQWSADPSRRGVGTITLVSPSGDGLDLLANNSVRSGKLAAFIELRDQVLVQAQTQLDAIAAAMSQALSDRVTAGNAVTFGAQSGFDVDLSGLLAGNAVHVSYTDVATGTQHWVTLVRVDDPGALPLSDDATADPNDRVVGISFGGGMASVASQIGGALGANFSVTNPSGMVLRILDDGTATVVLNAVSATKTATTFTSGGMELPFFTDGSIPYTGAFTARGSQSTGFAGRIAVNGALLSDPSKLVVYSASSPTPAGDVARAAFIYQRLTNANLTFPADTGVGTAAAPFQASLRAFLGQVISQQGQAAVDADNLKQGQQVVVNALQQRFSDASGVNIDQEMANLLQLQSAYGANARVLSAVKEMLDLLSKI